MSLAVNGLSGLALLLAGWGFLQGWFDALTQTLAWSAVFFLASAAASSAYPTASELFPLEMRALAISIFSRSAPAWVASPHPRCSAR